MVGFRHAALSAVFAVAVHSGSVAADSPFDSLTNAFSEFARVISIPFAAVSQWAFGESEEPENDGANSSDVLQGSEAALPESEKQESAIAAPAAEEEAPANSEVLASVDSSRGAASEDEAKTTAEKEVTETENEAAKDAVEGFAADKQTPAEAPSENSFLQTEAPLPTAESHESLHPEQEN